MKAILNVDAITPPLTGIGHYALRLARGLSHHPGVEEIKFFSGYRWINDPEQALVANRHIARGRRWVPFKILALHAYNLGRSNLFRWQTRSLETHVLHSPNYILMPFAGPSVTTVHDLSYIHHSQHHPRERIAFMERHMPRTLSQAAAVITDSEFVRQEVIDILGVSAEKVTTVPLGIDASFHPREEAALLPVLQEYSLSYGTYLLVVATLEPRKNLLRLVEAYSRLAASLRNRYPLVLVGAKGWLSEALERRLTPLERKGQIHRLGYVSQQDLPVIYAGARAFALPSLYEGFGLPVLEAMASGVPVLTSNRSSLPEVVEDTGILVEPESVENISQGLERLLVDEIFRVKAREKGLERARQFSWERCVDETVAVYCRAASN